MHEPQTTAARQRRACDLLEMKGDRDRAISDLKKCFDLASNTDLREGTEQLLSKLVTQ